MTEDKMVGWHHQLNGHESEQTQGDSEGLPFSCINEEASRIRVRSGKVMWVVETTSLVGRCLDSSRVMRVECYDIELKARTPEIESRGYRYIM